MNWAESDEPWAKEKLAWAMLRRDVKKRDGKCVRCGSADKDKFTVDHIIPRGCGGPNLMYNVQWLCDGCHKAKNKMLKPVQQGRDLGTMTHDEYIEQTITICMKFQEEINERQLQMGEAVCL